MLTMWCDSVRGPVVSLRHVGFEQRTPTRLASVSCVCFENSSRAMSLSLTSNEKLSGSGHAVRWSDFIRQWTRSSTGIDDIAVLITCDPDPLFRSKAELRAIFRQLPVRSASLPF